MPTEPSPLVLQLTGGRTLTVTPAADGFPSKVYVQIEGGGFAPWIEASWKPESSHSRRLLARETNLPDTEVADLSIKIIEWAAQESNRRASAQVPTQAEGGPYGIVIRGMKETAQQGRTYPAADPAEVYALLKRDNFAPDTVVEWEKEQLNRLALMDLDFHDKTQVPQPGELDEFLNKLSPTPFCAWLTQGGGIHACYAGIQPYTAVELASAAAAHLLGDDRVRYYKGSVEIINHTRHPSVLQKGLKCGPLHPNVPDTNMACLSRFSSAGASAEQIEEALVLLGVQIGELLPHDRCPIDPNHVSNNQKPVKITESGVYCFSCAARDGNGFMSWGKIRKKIGCEANGHLETAPILDAAKNFVHWAHVEYLMAEVADEIPEKFRKSLYSALLKSFHNDDPRIEKVFHTYYFVRGRDGWLHAETLMPVGRRLSLMDVAPLPSVQRLIDVEDEAKPDSHLIPVEVSTHTNDGLLKGWTPIQANPFVPIFSVHNKIKNRHGTIVCRPRKLTLAQSHVHYIAPSIRIPLEKAEEHIQNKFPGISMLYVEALIIAMGCAESGAGKVPMIWASGPSGAAKTTTIKIVEEMFGETAANLSKTKEDRLDEIFAQSLSRTRVILFDDFAKIPDEYKRLHSFFIRIDRYTTFHRLFKGEETVAVNSMVAFTDMRTPDYFTTDVQFGRRVHFIRLNLLPKSWEAIPGSSVEGWCYSDEATKLAAESYFSHLVDKHFAEGCTDTFDMRMEKLGVPRVVDVFDADNSEEKSSLRDTVKQLIQELGDSPDPVGDVIKRVGKGAREVVWGGARGIGKLCTQLVESLGEVRMDAENLHHVLESFNSELSSMYLLTCESAAFHIKQHGKKTFIRLMEEGRTKQARSKLVNKELFTTWPPTEKDSAIIPVEGDIEGAGVLDDVAPAMTDDSFWGGAFVESKNGTLTVYIDFETQSACDLKKGGSYVYAQHPTTKAVCCAVVVQKQRIFWTLEKYEGLVMPEGVIYEYGIQFFHDMIAAGVTIVAHNKEFERAIWVYTLKLPEPLFWRDTADLTLSRGLPAGLDQAGEYLFGTGKDTEGHQLMMRMCRPNKRGEMPVFTTEIMQRYIQYNFTDVYLQYAIAQRFGVDIEPAWEQRVADMHNKINFRGMGLDIEYAKTLRSFDQVFKYEAGQRVENLTRNPETGIPDIKAADLTRNAFLIEKMADQGLMLDNMQAGTIEKIIDDSENVWDEETKDAYAECVEILKNRLVVTRAALSKVDKALMCVAADGRVKAQFRYHGAHTGRWSGYQIQPQNFKRPDESFDLQAAIRAIEAKDLAKFTELCKGQPPYELLGSLVRGMIIPAPGHVFVAADYNQIESRMLMWLSEDDEGLQEHRDSDAGRGPNVYCTFGGSLAGHTITKKTDPDWYQAGKIGQLACIAEDEQVHFKNEKDIGWKPIQHITLEDKVWDGLGWVSHEGLLDKGEKSCIMIEGVWMTPDHKILKNDQWVEAGKINKIYRSRTARTYDLLNAGSHHRFTLSSTYGKMIVSNCGYQGGAGAVNRFALTYNVDFNALGIEPQSIVTGWREKYHRAVKLWKEYDRAFRNAIIDTGREWYAGKCYFTGYGDRVEIRLPSGRILTYMNARLEESDRFEGATQIVYDSATNGRAVKHSIYGGKIAENIDQAISRDLLADAMLRTEDAGLPIVLHVHDEEVPEVPENKADEALIIVRQIMSTPPDWCQGIPLVGEPQIMRRYGK